MWAASAAGTVYGLALIYGTTPICIASFARARSPGRASSDPASAMRRVSGPQFPAFGPQLHVFLPLLPGSSLIFIVREGAGDGPVSIAGIAPANRSYCVLTADRMNRYASVAADS